MSSSSSSSNNNSKNPGDQLRASTGKRPSLHPTTINAISQALLIRSYPKSYPDIPIQISTTSSDDTQEYTALDVAVSAGKIAMEAIDKRTKASTAVEGDDDSVFTPTECQLVAGRVVGVVMRFQELEQLLLERVNGVSWVSKYGEEASFGILSNELKLFKDGELENCQDEVCSMLKDDPLLRMCRAECLLGLFLHTIEQPSLEQAGKTADDGAVVSDFLDSDRIEALFPIQ